MAALSSDTYVLWRLINGFSGCLSGKRSLKNLEQDKKFKERDTKRKRKRKKKEEEEEEEECRCSWRKSFTSFDSFGRSLTTRQSQERS